MSVAVVGLGNLLLSDEGVGVHVVQRMAADYSVPEDVAIIDGGTSAIDLLDQLVEAEHIIFIDAARTGGPPGRVIELSGAQLPAWFRQRVSPHQIGLADLLATLTLVDHAPKSVTLIGIEPRSIDLGTELTPSVETAAAEALRRVVAKLAALGLPALARGEAAGPTPCV